MIFDRQKALDAFAAYAARYNDRDPKVRLKIDHTYRVAGLCRRIAQSLDLSPEDTELAWLCGLLHDMGRFEQLRRYGTFNDAVSIDHAACGAQVLFEEGRIRDYLDAATEDELLHKAVALHSVYRLPELDERTALFCNILRDADKIDILRVNVEVPLEEIYNVSSKELHASPISPEVAAAFYEHHAVLRALKHWPADNVVGHMSLVYEMVFPESLRIVKEQGWLDRLMAFSSENPDTARTLGEMRDHMHAWLDARLQG